MTSGFALGLALCLGLGGAPALCVAGDLALGSKTPYESQQTDAQREAAPKGFVPVGVQLVARHGARGLTKPGADEKALDLWTRAEAAQALTPRGRQFGEDLKAMMAAQRRLGYGNLSALGVREHRELAEHLVRRLPGLFAAGPVVDARSSGVDRAVDSARNFMERLRELAPKARLPVAATPDRFLLYFHRLSEKLDGAAAHTPEQRATLKRSQEYQDWLKTSEALKQRQRQVDADPRLPVAARELLTRLYATAFVDQLEREGQLVSSANLIVDLRGAAADLTLELGVEPTRRMLDLVPLAQARVFEEHDDAEDFYRKGPGVAQDGPITYVMADSLLADMLERLAGGQGVALRFAHAEIIAPLVSLIGVAGVHQPAQDGQPYAWRNNPWRAARVIPMAANVQWEVWQGPAGERLVRQLLNEADADFKPTCDDARWRPGSHFYRADGVLKCYRRP